MQSVIHQINLGQHIGSMDDAHIAGMEAGFEALRRYKPSMGTLETYILPQINYAVLQHIRSERSRSVAGIRALYAKMSGAKTTEEKEYLAGEFPGMTTVGPETEAYTLGSDEVIEAAQALLSRDEALDELERTLGKILIGSKSAWK